ncbi:response regulator [Flavobacterium endoglycinae]|uniref:Response regulator n=1 Tax=Flavobacterium endoglycinae TaxID=2816357 RepID=A0ABX7QDF0_9FLAO|nr:response regulator [Flavobacterium endoglycinae]QSW88434.1 response regulator [Flavobacterium endoglycinae]
MMNSKNSAESAKGLNEIEPVKIILADDDKDDQELFKDALDAADIPSDVTAVDNGQQLLDRLKDDAEPNPDMVFIDVNMPVKGGRQALNEIRSDEKLKDIPAVMLSTSGHPQDIEDALSHGADLYIQKPNSFTGFVLLLKKVFSLHWAKTLTNPLKDFFFLSENNISKKD